MAPLDVRVEVDREDSEHGGKSRRSSKVVIVISSAVIAAFLSTLISSGVVESRQSRLEEDIRRQEATLRALTGKVAVLEERTVKGSIPLLPEQMSAGEKHAVP